MQFTRNKRVIDRYFDSFPHLYTSYDCYRAVLMDYLRTKKLHKPSDVISRVRMIHTTMMYIGVGRFINKMGILLSAERCQSFGQIEKDHSHNNGVVPPREVIKILKKRRYIIISRYKNKTMVFHKRYNPEHIWLQKHKLI